MCALHGKAHYGFTFDLHRLSDVTVGDVVT